MDCKKRGDSDEVIVARQAILSSRKEGDTSASKFVGTAYYQG